MGTRIPKTGKTSSGLPEKTTAEQDQADETPKRGESMNIGKSFRLHTLPCKVIFVAVPLAMTCIFITGCGVMVQAGSSANVAQTSSSPTPAPDPGPAPSAPTPTPTPAPAPPMPTPDPGPAPSAPTPTPTPAPPTPTPDPGPAPSAPTPNPLPTAPSSNYQLPTWAATGFDGTEGAVGTFSQRIFYAADYGASGSDTTGTCSAQAGSKHLTCSIPTNDFKPGQGIRLVSAGSATVATPLLEQPVVVPNQIGTSGTHTYCYVVSGADPLGGITAPSPQTCVTNEDTLSLAGISNFLVKTSKLENGHEPQDGGPTPAFLWYVSQDGGPFQLVSVSGFFSATSDVGQRPTSRGGWPTQLPAGNPDISKHQDFFSTIVNVDNNGITIADPVISTVTETVLAHDDDDAVENAYLAADTAGGGTVQLGPGTYNLFRPWFHAAYPDGLHYRQMKYYWWEGFSYLYLPDNSHGNVNLQGAGVQTIVRTPPDRGGAAVLLDVGQPVLSPFPDAPIAIENVAKGATTIRLLNPNRESQPGDDIELYSGSFGYGPGQCTATSGEPSNCHFGELNTVAARDGDMITLAYPTNAKYYDDGLSNFGLTVRTHLPVIAVPHRVGFQHTTLDSYNGVFLTGNVIGLLINDVHITGFVSHGPFAGGSKRDITIQNSSWGTGTGDASWNGTNELDKTNNVVFRNDTVTGYAAPSAEGLSTGARIYVTEGSSRFLFQNNSFRNILLLFQSTTDDAVVQNTFRNGEVNMGYAYDNNTYNYTAYHNASYLSFASQENALIDSNVFTEDSSYQAPVIINLGNFTNGIISNNVITDESNRDIPVISSYGGSIINNTINLTAATQNSTGIALLPDPNPLGPGTAIQARHNIVNSPSHVWAGISLISPDVTAGTPICLSDNVLNASSGNQILNNDAAIFNLSCGELN